MFFVAVDFFFFCSNLDFQNVVTTDSEIIVKFRDRHQIEVVGYDGFLLNIKACLSYLYVFAGVLPKSSGCLTSGTLVNVG